MPSSFTVYFDDPFWTGVLEVTDPDGVRAVRHVFGAEPTGPELLAFAAREFDGLYRRALAAPPVPANQVQRPRARNPKRLARAAAREQAGRPVSTAAQEALSRAREQAATESRTAAKRRRAAEDEQRRAVARERARSRHRGR